MDVGEIRVPTLKKLLVDIQKEDDFDYIQGSEVSYLYQMALNQYSVNTQRLLRYAKRRNMGAIIETLLNYTRNNGKIE